MAPFLVSVIVLIDGQVAGDIELRGTSACIGDFFGASVPNGKAGGWWNEEQMYLRCMSTLSVWIALFNFMIDWFMLEMSEVITWWFLTLMGLFCIFCYCWCKLLGIGGFDVKLWNVLRKKRESQNISLSYLIVKPLHRPASHCLDGTR